MPRPPSSPDHPLRTLRSRLGLSRESLAQLVGVSKDAIVSLENGRLILSRRLAMRIALLTGTSAKELIKGSDGKLLNSRGKPYTPSDFLRAKRSFANPPADVIALFAAKIERRVHAALTAAAKTGNFARAYCDIQDAIDGSGRDTKR